MKTLELISSVIPAAALVGGGLWKLGASLLAMSRAVERVLVMTASHEKRLRALEVRAGVRLPRQRPPG